MVSLIRKVRSAAIGIRSLAGARGRELGSPRRGDPLHLKIAPLTIHLRLTAIFVRAMTSRQSHGHLENHASDMSATISHDIDYLNVSSKPGDPSVSTKNSLWAYTLVS